MLYLSSLNGSNEGTMSIGSDGYLQNVLVGNIIFFHLINKYLILRMSKIPDMIDFLVFETCVGYALNFPLLYGLGSIIFLHLRDDDA